MGKNQMNLPKYYVVVIETTNGNWDYIRVESSWTYEKEIKKFCSLKDAEEEAKRWNTGQVQEWKFYER